jgi:hypothetical protein
MGVLQSLASGLAGACAVTLVNEVARRRVPDAPRLDLLGMRALGKTARAAGQEPPEGEDLRGAALAGDLVSNTLYYSMVGVGGESNAVLKGTLLGLGAGLGAVLLPGPMGLGEDASAKTPQTAAMTVAWYVAGGLAAAGVYSLMSRSESA